MDRVLLVSFVLSLVGCPCSPRAPRERDAGVRAAVRSTHDEFQPPPGAEVSDTVVTARYRADVVRAEAPGYAVGRQNSFSIELKTTAGSTIPLARPAHVELRAPAGLGLSRTRMERESASVNTDSRILVEVPFLPMETGEGRVDAVLHFTVCTGEPCEDRVEHLRFSIDVH